MVLFVLAGPVLVLVYLRWQLEMLQTLTWGMPVLVGRSKQTQLVCPLKLLIKQTLLLIESLPAMSCNLLPIGTLSFLERVCTGTRLWRICYHTFWIS